MTIEELYGAVAQALGYGPAGAADPRVTIATDAAVDLASWYCHGDAARAAPPTTVDLDAPLVVAGLVPLAVRIAKDPASPAGLLESDAYTGAIIPADLLAHLHHYFDPFRAVTDGPFGVA